VDTDIFAQIVRNHQRAVFAVAYARLRNTHDAEDVMQEVFIEAYRNYHKVKNIGNVRAWLHKATIYRCKDHVRKSIRREKREHIFADSVSGHQFADAQNRAERRTTVLEAVGLLPEKYRLVIMLKHFAQLSYEEISEMTGLSKTVIGSRLQLARNKLKTTLIEMDEGDE
jgi:RNA polymerase sigma-70 factor (ECF subfamily)